MKREKVTVTINKPRKCGECPFYSVSTYTCHNERGYLPQCSLGHMNYGDMRDKDYSDSLYEGCMLGKKIEKKSKISY